jgi:adenosylmethionine-8-amino-7-oxononanoate aminotransferase
MALFWPWKWKQVKQMGTSTRLGMISTSISCILMRPLGNTIYILAPYCIEDEDLAYIYGKITAFAQGLV